jgi:hypothetical protein
MTGFFEEQAKRLYSLSELEAEALEVLRLVVRQTERGENLDAELLEGAKAIVDSVRQGNDARARNAGRHPFRKES